MKNAGVKRILRMMCMVLFAIALCTEGLRPANAFADEDSTGTLIVNYAYSNNEFHIFRVAENTADGFVPVEAYKDYRISLEAGTASEWRALAATLSVYTQRDRITPLADQITDNSGSAQFRGLESGMYLVMGESQMKDGYNYQPIPFLIILEKAESLTAQVKYEEDYAGGGDVPEKIDLSVRKVWKDNGSESSRPDNVIIQLLNNGEVYDTAVLNKENQWSYVWKDLASDGNWKVAEDRIPADYTVSIEQENLTFTVTNTRTGTITISGSTADSASSASGPQSPKTGDENKIIWWLIILAASGAVVRTAGYFVGKRKKE